ncbi:MAG TPA: AAA family ATPase [Chlamydiales bacterium]|nr:AAA family ATPase [Chlamydiales bacterium]
MIAGPNGAGKTTMTLELIRDCRMLYEFINADEIARGLAPKHPESMALTASKLMIKRLKELLEAKKNFVFETTASGTNYIKYLNAAKIEGYELSLTFLWLSAPEEAVRRVAQRVQQGGHNIPEASIIRRYYSGIKNIITKYLPLVDEALIIDSSSQEQEGLVQSEWVEREKSAKRVIARKNKHGSVQVLDRLIWRKMEKIADEQE